MEPGEKVLSDVHLNIESCYLLKENRSVSRFNFNFKTAFQREYFCKSNSNRDTSTTGQDNSDSSAQVDGLPVRKFRHLAKLDGKCSDANSADKTSVEQKKLVLPDKDIPKERKDTETGDEGAMVIRKKRRKGVETDEDGDAIVTRKKRHLADTDSSLDFEVEHLQVITLEHSLSTELPDVGEQVWNGSLLLCDFIVNHRSLFEGRVLLDLGAGTGLTSIVSCIVASKVFCTDIGKNILELAEHNLNLNSDLHGHAKFSVKELDWFQEDLKTGKEPFSLSERDIQELREAQVLLAADVVYDDDITDAFFRTVYNLMSHGCHKVLYISIEKRLLFTWAELDVACPAYTHFRECLEDLHLLNDEHYKYQYSQLPAEFPQCFDYKRTKELELWKVTTIPNGKLPCNPDRSTVHFSHYQHLYHE